MSDNRMAAVSISNRLPQLDVLRAVAILLVLGAHPAIKGEDAGAFLPLALFWHRVGWTGVDLFFVLSGFLIGGLLFAELASSGTLDVRRFLVRRAFKIWPAYYTYLAFLAVFLLRFGRGPGILAPLFVHVQNYWNPASVGGHTWSLAIEEHFYLALPLLLFWVIPLRQPRILAAVVFSLFILCGVMRTQSNDHYGNLFVFTHLRIDSLAFGVLLACIYHRCRPAFDRFTRHRALLFALGSALVILATHERFLAVKVAHAVVPASLALGYGAILVALVSIPLDGGPAARLFLTPPVRALAFVGLYSYSIYLWHLDITYRIMATLVLNGWLSILPPWSHWSIGTTCYVLLAVAVGVLMGRCVEEPFLALRDRLFQSRVRPVTRPILGETSLPSFETTR